MTTDDVVYEHPSILEMASEGTLLQSMPRGDDELDGVALKVTDRDDWAVTGYDGLKTSVDVLTLCPRWVYLQQLEPR